MSPSLDDYEWVGSLERQRGTGRQTFAADGTVTERADIYAPCHELGGMTAHYRAHDPQRLAFVAARYLFVAKMLEGCTNVLEIGCADGEFTPIVRQHVGALTAIDTDRASIAEANLAWPLDGRRSIDFRCMDAMAQPELWFADFDGIYALDVLEHIPAGEPEKQFLRRLAARSSMGDYCVVVGMPSLESQSHASELSRAGHVNCKTGPEFSKTLRAHFAHVLPFSMTDGALYPGFSPMARYYLAVCTG